MRNMVIAYLVEFTEHSSEALSKLDDGKLLMLYNETRDNVTAMLAE